MSGDDAVWITGMGASTPAGHSFGEIAGNLLEGRSGIRAVDEFPVQDQPSRVAGRVDRIPCPPGRDPAEFAARRPLERLVLWCAEAALRDSGHWDRREGLRVGLVLGLGAEWLITWEGDALQAGQAQPWRPEGYVDRVRGELGLTGPSLGLSAACASGNHALAVARQWLRLGWADVCLAGGCDMAVTPMSMACFGNLRALSRRNDDPARACRPFDAARDGFVIGEGGAVFVLEPAGAARHRGARVYAEALAAADRMLITWVDDEPEGDTFFPDVDWSAWEEVAREDFPGGWWSTYHRRSVPSPGGSEHGAPRTPSPSGCLGPNQTARPGPGAGGAANGNLQP